MHRSWHRGLSAAAIAAILLAGCGTKPLVQGETPPAPQTGASQGTGGGEQPADQPKTPAPAVPKEGENKKETIKVYYSDAQLEKLVEKEASISFKQDKDKYAAALQQLKTPPDSGSLTLFKGFTFKSVELKDSQLTIDLSIADEGRLGAGGEEMMLEALQKTLFQFKEIQAIDILVDGKAVDSLMGHMELSHPIKRS